MDSEQLQLVFSKTLSKTDVNHRLAFPVRLVGHIWWPYGPRDNKPFRVVDRFGEVWVLQAHMRQDPQGHEKPEVYGPGWKKFVKQNQLKPGDELVFYRHPDPNPTRVTFVVSIKREITLMGQTFSGHIRPLNA